MSATTAIRKTRLGAPPLAIWKAVLVVLPVAAFGGLVLLQPGPEPDLAWMLASVLSWLLFMGSFLLMLTSGLTHRLRSILFIAVAIMLPANFVPHMIETYGTMALTQGNFIDAGAAFCPLAFPMILLPAVVTRTVIFPSVLLGSTGIIGMSALLLAASVTVGRGWCSWLCFYGGWDELFSRIPRRVRVRQINPRWIYFPFAMLLAVVLSSALTMGVTYCEWICPFKVLTEFAAPTSALIVFQTVLFVGAFVALVVVLPLLTKKRVQCGLFCPLGALQSFWNKISIFGVRIDQDKCIQCKRCIRECPTLSLNEASLESGKPLMTCTRCGKCMDVCPKNAISYHIKGTKVGLRPNLARVLFMYPAWILLSVLGAGIVQAGLFRILRLIMTGSMLLH